MDEQKLESKKKKNIIPIIVAIAAVIVLVAVLVIVLVVNSKPSKVNRHMKTAEKYMSELDYKSAVAEYKAVIEIDSKNVEAYLGLANAYVELDKIDKAIAALEDGYEETDNDRIKDRLDELVEYRENHPDEADSSKDDDGDGDVKDEANVGGSDGVTEDDDGKEKNQNGAPDIDYDELIDILISCGDMEGHHWDGRSDFSYLIDKYGLVYDEQYYDSTYIRRIYSEDERYVGLKNTTSYEYWTYIDDTGCGYMYEEIYCADDDGSLPGNTISWGRVDDYCRINVTYCRNLCTSNFGLCKFAEKYNVSTVGEYLDLIGLELKEDSYVIYDNVNTYRYGKIMLMVNKSDLGDGFFSIIFEDGEYEAIDLKDFEYGTVYTVNGVEADTMELSIEFR